MLTTSSVGNRLEVRWFNLIFFFNSAIFSSLQYIYPIFGEFAGNSSPQLFDNFSFYAELVPLEKKHCSEIKLTWNISGRVD